MDRKMREWQLHDVQAAMGQKPKNMNTAHRSQIFRHPSQSSLIRWVSLGIVATFLICLCVFIGCDEPLCSFQVKQFTSSANLQIHEISRDSTTVKEEEVVVDGADVECAGRYIYMYDLPSDFNQFLVEKCENVQAWPDMCENLSNQGLGTPIELPQNDSLANILLPKDAWFQTDQFNLEVMFHERVKSYPCLTVDPTKAAMFYIPFYPAVDLTRNLVTPAMNLRDRMCERLVGWLQGNRNWQRLRGQKHFFVLGRIVWDFVRRENEVHSWGNVLLQLSELRNITKLLIERASTGIAGHDDDRRLIAVPYPTSFHPSTDLEIQNWQNIVRHSERDLLVSLAGSSRNKNMSGEVRGVLLDACENSEQCTLVRCTHQTCVRRPQTITELSLRSVFCLQPPGDSATRKGIFDCMLAGCIPVFFDQLSAYQQYTWHLPVNGSSYSVFIKAEDVMEKRVDVIEYLSREYSTEAITSLRETIITQILPAILYKKPTAPATAINSASSSSSSIQFFTKTQKQLGEKQQADEEQQRPHSELATTTTTMPQFPDAFDLAIQQLLAKFKSEDLNTQ